MYAEGNPITVNQLPGLNCGLCGMPTCQEFADRLVAEPGLLERCVHLAGPHVMTPARMTPGALKTTAAETPAGCGACVVGQVQNARSRLEPTWRDTLGREFDFYLEHFPEEPGPREIMIPHNPMLTREMDIQPGDVLIGRPLGMSCGCPITHCGVAMQVDKRTGVIVWCVTGPLQPRQSGFKDLGYYIAEGYEGLISQARVDVKIGARYFFQPRMCMLQWRHSGLVNFINRTADGLQVRLEGLWIG